MRQINVEVAAHEAGVPFSTLRYDLNKVAQALPEMLVNRQPGPKPQHRTVSETVETRSPEEAATICPACGGKATKNGTYWVLNWLLMLTAVWLGVQRIRIQRRRCRVCGYELILPEQARQAEGRRDWWRQVNRIVRLFDEAVRDITLDVPKGLPFKERKKQRQLKRRLLRQRLQPMLSLVFKPFSRIAKFFPLPERCQSFFAGVALMENFDVKLCGSNQGTSAMQRAKINLDDFDATDFFSTVDLPMPQISLAHITD